MDEKRNTIYLHPALGADTNSGSLDSPLRTLSEASRRVNQMSGAGPITLILSEGIYAIGETVVFKPEHWTFSREARLTVRAGVLPDDPDWHAGRMPALIHTMPIPPDWNGRPDKLGGAADGMLVETSHVSILGLKILGIPVVESPMPGVIRRLYGISRLRRDLEDLEIGHCIFAGDEVTNPFHVGIIAHGSSIHVHHCIFRGLKISVVYWSGGSSGHAMQNCLCDGLYGSAVWTAGISNNFVYQNNVVMNSNYVWTYQSGASAAADDGGGAASKQTGSSPAKPQWDNHYKVENSYFANNHMLTGSGTGARLEYQDIDSSFLELEGTTITNQPVILERDQTKRNYLHPVAGSEAQKVGAGLFLSH
jgi:hypothetical protein